MRKLASIRQIVHSSWLCLALALLGGGCGGPASAPKTGRVGASPAADREVPQAVSLCPPGKYRANGIRRAETRIAKSIRQQSRLVERDETGFELWETPQGPYWVVADNFDTTCWSLAEQQIDIYHTRSPSGIHPGDIVLDSGAHFGVFVRQALELGAKLVVAIEIAPENIECLRRTFSAEIEAGKVIVYPKGVWHKEDELVLQRARHTWAHHVSEEFHAGHDAAGGEETIVPLTTIDRIVSELELSRVDFIKMDIEGAESNAIRGAAETLERFRPRMAIASYHNDDDLEVIPATVLGSQPGYQWCLAGVGAGWGNLTLIFE